MTPQEFVAKWRGVELTERSASQSHFIDLCRLLDEPAPADADPTGEWYSFEKGVQKTGGGDGWADVWKRQCFGWEYKGKRKNLNEALRQLRLYHGALENPPLLIVSDMETIEIHTTWTNLVQEVYKLTLDDLLDASKRTILKNAFSASTVDRLKPAQRRSDLTAAVAGQFVELAQALRSRGGDPERVAHFINRMVFCMFAEDVGLLPNDMFKELLKTSRKDPTSFARNAQTLFSAMAKKGGRVGFKDIEWFNGGLFDTDDALELTADELDIAIAAANQVWSNIDPSIMGTLFERGLDPNKRSKLGAHYTDPKKS